MSQFVPDGMKDEKYWARRRKNNMAAKRSRDARRMKENQIALRAGYLEKEVRHFLKHNLNSYHEKETRFKRSSQILPSENLSEKKDSFCDLACLLTEYGTSTRDRAAEKGESGSS